MTDSQFRFAVIAMWLVTILLLGLLFVNPRAKENRFVPVTPNTAVDTATGRLCFTYDPIGGQDRIPSCEKLR